MKFLIDAHFPSRLACQLRKAGYDALHTRDLPQGNNTPDSIINDLSVREKRIVVTKDADFVQSFLLFHRPYKLLLVSTGNIRNVELESLFFHNIERIVKAFNAYDFVEINQTMFIFHM